MTVYYVSPWHNPLDFVSTNQHWALSAPHWLPLLSPAHSCLLNCDCQVKLFLQTWQLNGFSPLWATMCLVMWPFRENLLLQTEQTKGLSPVWVLMCWTRVWRWVNFVSQMEQEKGFSPVWIRWWATKSERCLNVLLQKEQLKGFSPVWTLMCLSSDQPWLKLLWHTEQLNGFSPEWRLMWATTCSLRVKRLLQKEQLNGFSPLWFLMCLFRFVLWTKVFPHSEQVNESLLIILLITEFKPAWGSLVPVQLSSLTSVSEESSVSGSGSGFLAGSGPPQSSSLASVSICEDWGFSSSSSSLFTGTAVKVNLVTSSSSWLVQSSSCSSLMCRGSGSAWSRLEVHSCCSGGTSSSLTDRWTSAGNRATVQIQNSSEPSGPHLNLQLFIHSYYSFSLV